MSLSPVEASIGAIASKVRSSDGLTAGGLVSLLGNASYPLVIMVLSMLNMIPGPPGYGGTIAITIISVTIATLLGNRLALGGWLGRRPLSQKLLERMMTQMQWFAGLVAKVSRPRLAQLTGPRTQLPTAIFILLVSLPMVLPIPFINAVPNTGIAIICVSRINHDGLGVLLGIVVALAGLAIAAGAVWGVVMLAGTVMG
ncbi:MAG: exopolysaccharide biosynthesis protein [Candidatus Devosia phytovorans]|uniref:Exopolysaccharide biosynthesis protein n=1 Tax=Candidatus Devosia phytovorans TaxID=3121372 RepID=A0AAJ6AYY0_9HYPH|nr:exopolysaccharide biosynthesis protein [Devosia sp.]WEK04085.1 MAG: exopolysaccharide biosynthesis protein [Devosia sp.]